jgi:release factor glutamine methyltransferase
MLGPSIGQQLVEAGEVLERAGIQDPRREALNLWARLSNTPLQNVWLARDAEAPEDEVYRFRAAVERRANGEPFAYVVGTVGFRYLDLHVDRSVLIPRPETEGLVERVLDWGRKRSDHADRGWGTGVDVGTGCGCIALSMAAECAFDRVIGTDVSRDALDVAAANLAAVELRTVVEFRQGATLEPLGGEVVDAVVSNPPYLTDAEYRALDRSVRDYEPKAALVSGEGGLEHTRRLVESARAALSPGGLLAIEVDCTRAERVVGLAREAGWGNACIERDTFGYSRYLLATKES